jgi:hypothetical protein
VAYLAGAPAPRPMSRNRTSRPGIGGTGNNRRTAAPRNNPGADRAARSKAERSVLVESSLRDINRSLEVKPDQATERVLDRCPGCDDPARPKEPPVVSAQDQALRGNLHRLKRETAQKQSSDLRRSRIEAAREP